MLAGLQGVRRCLEWSAGDSGQKSFGLVCFCVFCELTLSQLERQLPVIPYNLSNRNRILPNSARKLTPSTIPKGSLCGAKAHTWCVPVITKHEVGFTTTLPVLSSSATAAMDSSTTSKAQAQDAGIRPRPSNTIGETQVQTSRSNTGDTTRTDSTHSHTSNLCHGCIYPNGKPIPLTVQYHAPALHRPDDSSQYLITHGPLLRTTLETIVLKYESTYQEIMTQACARVSAALPEMLDGMNRWTEVDVSLSGDEGWTALSEGSLEEVKPLLDEEEAGVGFRCLVVDVVEGWREGEIQRWEREAEEEEREREKRRREGCGVM